MLVFRFRLILYPDSLEPKLEEPEIEQVQSNPRLEIEDPNSGTIEEDNKSHVKEEETTEDTPSDHPNHHAQVEDIVEPSEHSTTHNNQHTGSNLGDVEENGVHQVYSRESGADESHMGEQAVTDYQPEETIEDPSDENRQSNFFDDLQQESTRFDNLDRENGTNRLESAERWPTDERGEHIFQIGKDESSRPNPFEGLSEDPEFGQSMFGDETDDRPNPESQGYTLLQTDDNDGNTDPFDPEMGNTSADVHDAQQEDNTRSFHASQRDVHDENQFAAFSQVHESLSQGVTGLEFVAHQLVDPSESVPKEMTSQPPAPAGLGDFSGERWWSSNENGDRFNFGQQDEGRNPGKAFDSNSDVSQHFPVKEEDINEDPFSQMLTSDQPGQESVPKGTHCPESVLIIR